MIFSVIQCHGPCQQNDRALRGTICSQVGTADQTRSRGYINDASAAGFPHRLHRGAAKVEHTAYIGFEYLPPVVIRSVDGASAPNDPGAVDQDVYPSEALDGVSDHLVGEARVSYVTEHQLGCTTKFLNCLQNSLATLLIAPD
ncbi:hypothetical protein MPL3365_170118 [Mesorhizobium plurifarium]|uniref:Uncharacterized protein n=1 Tax=Mesorhizobium plurifarium TaxID=69974 RepID=A0A090FYW6_MESPL|nr:hypothetical protein MPL3365_170118 [Mesorhizobium plurifarium]